MYKHISAIIVTKIVRPTQGRQPAPRAYLAEGLDGVEERLHDLCLFLPVAVLDVGLPVAGLLLQVEGQAVRATQRLETLQKDKRRGR